MKKPWKLGTILLCLALLCSLCACGTEKTGSTGTNYSNDQKSYAMPSASYVAAEESMADYGGFSAAGGYSASENSLSAPMSEGNPENGTAGQELTPEKIIYSASATVESTQFDSALEALQELINRYGGWVESSSISGAKYSSLSSGRKTYRSASYTIRIPSERFQEVMGSLSELGNVPYSHVYSENVTSQYYDTQARLKTYEAQEQRLIELLDKAETVSDVIEIENELTDVRYRIESLQTTLRGWDRRVSWSTIDLSVNEVSEYTPDVKVSYGSRLWKALCNGVSAMGDFFVDFVEALPSLVLLGAIAAGVVQLIRVLWRKRSTRRKEKKENNSAEK